MSIDKADLKAAKQHGSRFQQKDEDEPGSEDMVTTPSTTAYPPLDDGSNDNSLQSASASEAESSATPQDVEEPSTSETSFPLTKTNAEINPHGELEESSRQSLPDGPISQVPVSTALG